MEKEGIDYFNPAIVMALLMAAMSDAAFLTIFFWFVPVSGLVIAALVIGFHYFAAFAVAFLIFPKITKGSLLGNIAGIATLDVGSAMLLAAKIFLVLAMVLPAPLLALAILVAIIAANKLVQLAASIALVVAAPEVGAPAKAAKTAVGAAKAVEAGATAAEVSAAAAEAGAAGVEAAETVGVAEVAPGVGEAATEAPKGKPSEKPTPEKPKVPPGALGERLEPQEELEEELLGEEGLKPSQDKKEEEAEEEGGGNEEEFPKAA